MILEVLSIPKDSMILWGWKGAKGCRSDAIAQEAENCQTTELLAVRHTPSCLSTLLCRAGAAAQRAKTTQSHCT